MLINELFLLQMNCTYKILIREMMIVRNVLKIYISDSVFVSAIKIKTTLYLYVYAMCMFVSFELPQDRSQTKVSLCFMCLIFRTRKSFDLISKLKEIDRKNGRTRLSTGEKFDGIFQDAILG